MRKAKWRIVMFGLVAVISASVLLAVSELGVFELDGNATESATPGEDWQTVNAIGYNHDGLGGHAIDVTGVIPDMHPDSNSDPTAFFNKQTKDIVDLPGNWTWKATSVPDKDDLNNAYAAAYVKDGDLIITFGADRYSAGNGDAFLGFWFFQSDIGLVGQTSGTFSGEHVAGDVLVLVNFQGGGSTPNIKVLQWAPGAPNNLQEVYSGEAKCGEDAGIPACAITNEGPVTLYWPFAYKNTPSCEGPTCIAPSLAFFEGAVNLSALFPELPCITSFLAETRSSSSVTADLKDFVTHPFSLCSIGIGKACGSWVSNGTTITYTNNITVTNTGTGVLYDALVTDSYVPGPGTNPVTRYFAATGKCGSLTPCTEVPALASLASGSSVIIPETFDSTLTTGSDSATVAAAPKVGAARTVLPPGPASVACPVPVSAAVTVDKSCVENGAEFVMDGGVLKVKVTVQGSITNNSTNTAIDITDISDIPEIPGGSR